MFQIWHAFTAVCAVWLLQFGACQDIRFYAIGDWGDPILNNQERVADAMAIHAETFQPHLIQSLGDNFYQNGISSTDDEEIDILWRYMYNHTSLADLNWFIALGNHDYGSGLLGNEWNQVNLTYVEPRWNLPHLWHDYVLVSNEPKTSVHVAVIDSEALREEVNDFQNMMPWLNQTLTDTTADWSIVVAHHPIYSVGEKGPVSNSMHSNLIPLLEQHNVDVYLTGHDHNLQYLRKIGDPSYTDFVISGAGGALGYFERPGYEEELQDVYGIESVLFAKEYGFAAFTITPTTLTVDYISEFNTNLYSFTRTKSGK